MQKLLLFFSLIVFSSCMKTNSAIETSSQKVADSLACGSFKSSVFDSMYDYLESEKSAPLVIEFTQSLNEKLEPVFIKNKIESSEKKNQLKQELAKLYGFLIEDSKKMMQRKTNLEHIQTLIELEMEDVSTKTNETMNASLEIQLDKVNAVVQSMDLHCEQPDPNTGLVEEPLVNASKMTNGVDNVFATAYQSCQALDVPEVNRSTASVEGITINGTHADTIGSKRFVTDLAKVQQTHPYIRAAGDGSVNGCFNVRGNPLIYDYGGKPSSAKNVLSFFKNDGSGTSVLGIDCSGYVASAAAAAGLRYSPNLENKAIYTNQQAVKYINAKTSGFKCYKNVTMTASANIKPGDIVGVKGHVVVIDKTGLDPFGLKKLKTISDCEKIDFNNFDFVISQSSPSKNGLGINKYIIKDYLPESTKMRAAFLGLAKASCEAFFTNKTVAATTSEWGAIRHTGTKECLAPKIQMANQSCVSQCLK